MKYSLIIPVYNEAPVIGKTLGDLSLAFTELAGASDWEIIVVDNGSQDDTARIARAERDPHIRIIEEIKKGKGHAIRIGMRAASGEYCGFTDVDLSISPYEIVHAFHAAAEGKHSILIGSRFHPESVMPGREWWRTLSSTLYNQYARLMLGLSYQDTQCPLKIVDREGHALILLTTEETWFFDLEFLALAERAAQPVIEVPVNWREHHYPGRRSKLSTTRDGMRYLFALPRIKKRLPEQLSLWESANNNRV